MSPPATAATGVSASAQSPVICRALLQLSPETHAHNQ